jgi:hypothetical protein
VKKLEITAIYYQVSIIPRIRTVVYGGGVAESVRQDWFLYMFMDNRMHGTKL